MVQDSPIWTVCQKVVTIFHKSREGEQLRLGIIMTYYSCQPLFMWKIKYTYTLFKFVTRYLGIRYLHNLHIERIYILTQESAILSEDMEEDTDNTRKIKGILEKVFNDINNDGKTVVTHEQNSLHLSVISLGTEPAQVDHYYLRLICQIVSLNLGFRYSLLSAIK